MRNKKVVGLFDAMLGLHRVADNGRPTYKPFKTITLSEWKIDRDRLLEYERAVTFGSSMTSVFGNIPKIGRG